MTKELDLLAFHIASDSHVERTPTVPPLKVRELRWSLIEEECDEVIDAFHHIECAEELKDDELKEKALVKLADGLVDLVYVAIGTAISFGIPFDACWEEVQRTNMEKTDPKTGKIRRRRDGKILKPEGWQPPNIARVLRQAKERNHNG